MKKITTLLTLITLTLMSVVISPKAYSNSPQSVVEEKTEFRAAWASHLISSMPKYTTEAQFKARANEILDILQHYNYNALIMHFRTHNNAYYVSELNPKAAAFEDVNFNEFDPMLWFIEATHARGMEFHAWLNPYRLGTNYVGQMPAANPASNPANVLSYNGASILNPGLPNVRQFVSDTIVEILDRYPVDAIHFDDYFYINLGANGATTGSNTILNEPDQSTFITYGAGYNTESATSKADWRRHQVNLMVEGVSNTIKNYNQANNRHVQLGISPTGIYKNGNGEVTYDSNNHPITTGSDTGGQTHYSSYLFADSVKWATEGWIDYLIPQSYWADSHPIASYTKLMSWWNKVFKHLDVNLYSGIGVYMADSSGNTYGWKTNPNELKQQLEYIASLDQVDGFSMYSYNYIDSAYKNAANYSTTQIKNAESLWGNIAVLPEIKSMTSIQPGVVSNLKHENGILSFNKAEDAKQYYIYRSQNEFTYDPSEIIGVIRSNDSTLSFDTKDTLSAYQYDVRALSYTNTLGDPYVQSDVEVIDGAAIRSTGLDNNQALRFYAKLDPSIHPDSFGFYMMTGDVSISKLQQAINIEQQDNYIIDGVEVTRIPSTKLDTNNEFSVVVKDITPNNFSQIYKAVAYYQIDGDIYLSANATTRSVLEVVYRMHYAGDGNTDSLNLIKDIKLFGKNAFGNYQVTSIYETNYQHLKAAFIKDWNQTFNLSMTDILPNEFFNIAIDGKVADQSSLAGSRIYNFFNHNNMKVKWGWLLDYIVSVDDKVWPTRQIEAIRGDGTYPGQTNIWDGRHFITSLVGFFNHSYAYDGYPTNDFTGVSLYDTIVDFNEQILAKPDNYMYVYVGDQIVLPEHNTPGFSHYLVDGTIYQPGDSLVVGSHIIIEVIYS